VVTGLGRIPAGDFRMLLERAAAARRFEPLDRASQPVVDWPGGTSPYLYGGYFHEYLAERFGEDSLVRLADETARRLPYMGSRAYRTIFGHSLGALWNDFETHTAGRAPDAASASIRDRLTGHGFRVMAPAFSRDGRLFYSASNPHGFPGIYEWQAGGPPRRVASRVGGHRLAVAGDLLIFDQLEVVRNASVTSDLYVVQIDGGPVRRLTREARAADPDVTPDGRLLACTVQMADRRALALMPMPPMNTMGAPELLLSEAGVDYSNPRWSPDGRSIAVERRAVGAASEIVIVDASTREVRTIVSTAPARNVTPAWAADGSTLIFASDRQPGGFTLYEVAIATGAVGRFTDAGAGAQSPAFAPDARRLAFVGYTADGYDLFAIPAAGPREPTAAAPSGPAPAVPAATPSEDPVSPLDASRPYTPWRTLAPRFWIPIVSGDTSAVSIGAGTGGYDALGRHAWFATAAWAVEHQRPEWQIDYAYTRWRPLLFGRIADSVESWREGRVRSRDADAGVLVPIRRVRWTTSVLASFHAARDDLECAACVPTVNARVTRRAVRAGWAFSNARGFGYSISPEEGGAVTLTTEFARRAFGADANAGAAVIEARRYVEVVPRHGVIAGRFAAATTWGEAAGRRRFSASGSGPQSGSFSVGAGAIGLLRGVPEAEVRGHHAVVANLDYRFPLAWIQRGHATFPAMLRNLHGAVFADGAAAWDEGAGWPGWRRAIGGELSADTVWLYNVPLTFAAGVAWRDGTTDTRGWAAFGRVGRAF
jgi:dipeptidyl aminopeptidase/acylaminoacyl peptidase